MFRRSCLILILCAVPVSGGGALRSGPQVGEKLPGAFLPLNINGPDAGKNSCLYCRNGTNPVVMIFAREITPQLTELFRRLEAATAAHSDESMGSCAIFCTDAAQLNSRLTQLAKQAGLSHVVLASFAAAGPPRYKIAPEADVTILLYSNCTVRANRSFRKGEFTQASVDAIVSELPRIVASK